MKLSDINVSTFEKLSPEVQEQLISSQDMDPMILIAIVVIFVVPMFLMR